MKRTVALLMILMSLIWASNSFAQKWRIAHIIPTQLSPSYIEVQKCAKEVALENNIEYIPMAPIKSYNVEEQIRMVEDLIQKKVNAIIISPGDSRGIVPAIEKANQAGIPVITGFVEAAGGKVATHVAVDNYELACLQAEYMVKNLGGKGDIIILEGTPGTTPAQLRLRGYRDTLNKYPEIKVLASQTANFVRDMGMKVTENLLQRFPKIDAVLSANDWMSLGALEAIDAAGRSGSIKVYSCDCTKEAMEAIKEGRLASTMDMDYRVQGRLSMEAAIKVLKGEKLPPRIGPPVSVVDKSNVDAAIAKYSRKLPDL
jgi:ribose transport system substrate-binding protein